MAQEPWKGIDMPVGVAPFVGQEAMVAFAIAAIAAYLNTWAFTDLFGVSHVVYVAILAATVPGAGIRLRGLVGNDRRGVGDDVPGGVAADAFVGRPAGLR